MIAAIDADLLVYKFNYRNELAVDWLGDGNSTVFLDVDKAKRDMDTYIEWIKSKAGATDHVLILTGKNNFRYTVLPSYKHNRKDTAKPAMFTALQNHIKETHPFKQKDNLEGDDVLGIMSTQDPGKYVICTIDKDLKQIPGLLFNWNKDTAPAMVEAEDGQRYFYEQIIQGDSTDGYTGVPGVGAKGAGQLLDKAYKTYAEDKPKCSLEQHIWGYIKWLYAKSGLDEDFALRQARVARILQASDFNFKTGAPILWTPQ